MSNSLGDLYGEVETFKNNLPEGCEEVWADSKKRKIVIKWSDGTYRAAIFVDTEKHREEAKSLGMPSFRLDEDFVFYIVDATQNNDLEAALTRLQEWNEDILERMQSFINQMIEESKRRLEADRAMRFLRILR